MVRRTLMRRNQELVDFEIEPTTGEVRIVDLSEEGEDLLACADAVQQGGDWLLGKLVGSRAISAMRPDLESILGAFGAKSAVDLALMGHGLSLSDQYWYRAPGSAERWEDVNFFDNEWDPAFGAAVFEEDYARLASCSPDVPDATTRGHAVKTWERSGDGILLVKVSERYDGAELKGIKLASDMCAMLFAEGCYVPVSIVERCGRLCSATPLMLAHDEELVDGDWISMMTGILAKGGGRISPELCDVRISAYEAMGIKDASAHVARMACCSCLSLLADFHAGNFGAIRKVGSDVWRPAPIFDYDGSFGFPFAEGQISAFCEKPFLAELLCMHHFSYLRSSWDWSWYDPRALDGFEDCIVEAYASNGSLPSGFSELVVRLFTIQREYVNGIALASR